MISVDFDDLIFSIQSFGGASTYWREMTSRVARDPRFNARHLTPSRRWRGIPAASRAQVFHSSHFRVPFGSRKTGIVSTVHDLNYELGYVKPSFGAQVNILERRISYFTADALICISESTKRELLDVYPQLQARCPIHVVYHGMSELKSSPEARKTAAAHGRFVLYVGGRSGYKRFDDALAGFHASDLWKQGYTLLCTGQRLTIQEQATIESLGLSGAVKSVGNVDSPLLSALYASAHCLLYPSVHEGFGLPLIEAMQCGCPVVCADISCMPEIVEDAALLVRPQSPPDIARALKSLLMPGVREMHVERGIARAAQFSWDRCAAAHADIYQQVSLASKSAPA
ncbi:glycosyltransferase family 1 protein [Paucibacter sp. PLA-PC-4]|uniref:glycosyltransferase family 4 protein n=1 Tax=Paucibacter sp. PLA-PC-4 TaxID=2993655 RepID=UPI00224A6887|nr:glycosyltransferase family 1 protein [Paucibacter sp. PLA-PC-4]MCX2865134.1 glycosyltransferase family 1 protein [Paucibacter sp. PLA-PC-4]